LDRGEGHAAGDTAASTDEGGDEAEAEGDDDEDEGEAEGDDDDEDEAEAEDEDEEAEDEDDDAGGGSAAAAISAAALAASAALDPLARFDLALALARDEALAALHAENAALKRQLAELRAGTAV
jgi:hypothetical protein